MSRPLLHRRFPALARTVPHLRLGDGPTPVRRMTGLPLPVPVWCKDESGFGSGGWGGNKVRKLEWILPEAERRGARTLLTVGGLGTNWGLATALYAGEHGLHTALALIDQPLDDHVRAQFDRIRRSGATVHLTRTKARTIAAVPWLMARHTTARRPPYYVPAGGSAPVGTLGYVETALEIAGQVARGTLPEPSHAVLALGSGGTAAGLALGLRMAGLRTRVVGIVVNDTLPLDARSIAGLARRTERLLRRRGAATAAVGLRPEDLTVVRGWLGPGYGHPTPEAEAARHLAAREERLDLEPVYTAKAFAALLALGAEGRFGAGPVLFLHTHGPRGTG
ncbi:1-aminocyclopropane-1-carboxylate deaminase/D-cysteine desulfhydrase [Streptomyces sp. NPDC001922]|uniref:1-aminocyclopropane-1-carboxylate deaminase/D-cysteine desulfhydrase n=1 Tax=Streptomyces sp. NPDC001922 TaxID=3364624 RepID=UPI0036A27A3E